MDILQVLADQEGIRRLKSRYFRALDAKDWTAFGAVFTDDAVQDLTTDLNMALIPDGYATTTNKAGMNIGGAEIARWVAWCVGDAVTVHHGMMPDIEITGETTATGIWSFTDFLHWPGQPAEEAIRGAGYYLEEYRKVDGRWLISRSAITRGAGMSSGGVAPADRTQSRAS